MARPGQRARLPPDEVPVSHLAHDFPLAEHDLASDDGIARPIAELDALERGVVDGVMQHGVGKGEGLERLLRVPDGDVGVEARPDGALLLQSVQLGGVGRGELDEFLRRDAAGQHAGE